MGREGRELSHSHGESPWHNEDFNKRCNVSGRASLSLCLFPSPGKEYSSHGYLHRQVLLMPLLNSSSISCQRVRSLMRPSSYLSKSLGIAFCSELYSSRPMFIKYRSISPENGFPHSVKKWGKVIQFFLHQRWFFNSKTCNIFIKYLLYPKKDEQDIKSNEVA